jgi:hypothetical protein
MVANGECRARATYRCWLVAWRIGRNAFERRPFFCSTGVVTAVQTLSANTDVFHGRMTCQDEYSSSSH